MAALNAKLFASAGSSCMTRYTLVLKQGDNTLEHYGEFVYLYRHKTELFTFATKEFARRPTCIKCICISFNIYSHS